MTDDQLKQFVLNACDGKVFTSYGLEPSEVRSCFMIIALMEKDQIPKDAAIVWEYLSEAGPLSINGLPTFFSCHFMDSETWQRAHKAIVAEMDRRKNITV